MPKSEKITPGENSSRGRMEMVTSTKMENSSSGRMELVTSTKMENSLQMFAPTTIKEPTSMSSIQKQRMQWPEMTSRLCTTHQLAGRKTNTSKPVKNKDGNVITNLDRQLERWKDHFSELLN